MECGVSGVFTVQVPWGQKQQNQQNTAFNTNHSIKDTESLQKPSKYAIVHNSLSEQKNTVLKSISPLTTADTGNQWRHKIIEEGMKETKNNEQAFLCNSQSKINAYLHHYYKINTFQETYIL